MLKIFLDQIMWAVGENWSRDTCEGTSCVWAIGREEDLESSQSHLSLRRSWLNTCCCYLKTKRNLINERPRASVLYMLKIRSILPEIKAGLAFNCSSCHEFDMRPALCRVFRRSNLNLYVGG